MDEPKAAAHQCRDECITELEAAVIEAEIRANALASKLHEARTRAGAVWAAVNIPSGAPAEEIVLAVRFLLREPESAHAFPSHDFGAMPGLAEEYERRFGEPLPDVEAELQAALEAELGEHRLASNEQWAYNLIHRVMFRHAFFEHDCQTVPCKAMFLWNSREMTELLQDAYERGRAEPRP